LHQHSSISDAIAEDMAITTEGNDSYGQDGGNAVPIESADATSSSGIPRSLPYSVVGASHVRLFIRPLRSNLDPIELEYLRMKGAFWIPEKSALEELLQVYFDVVYPFSPILNRDDIMKVVKDQTHVCEGEDTRISLLLMQALLFVSSSVSS
jgi:hypothetical protein